MLGLGEVSKAEGTGGEVTVADAALLPGLQGKAATPPGGLYSCAAGEPVAVAGGKPLVTRVELDNGSRVLYLNYAAGQAGTRGLDGLILGDLLRSRGCVPSSDESADVYCHTYGVGPGNVAVLWARAPLEAFRFEYRGDIDQRLSYRSDVDVELRIAAAPGAWRTYDYLEGAESVVQADGRGLPYRLRGSCCALVYYGPDTAEWREWLQRVKAAPRPGEV